MIIKINDLTVLKSKGVYQIKNLSNNKIYIGDKI